MTVEVGDKCWHKFPSFPIWPAVVRLPRLLLAPPAAVLTAPLIPSPPSSLQRVDEADARVPAPALASRPDGAKDHVLLCYFGTKEFLWVPAKDAKPWAEGKKAAAKNKVRKGEREGERAQSASFALL